MALYKLRKVVFHVDIMKWFVITRNVTLTVLIKNMIQINEVGISGGSNSIQYITSQAGGTRLVQIIPSIKTRLGSGNCVVLDLSCVSASTWVSVFTERRNGKYAK